ncbi:MAG: HYR domain-containing protein [Cytophagales bacterium]|nr:HYR domain-containing protein [Cytophagales bacterium]
MSKKWLYLILFFSQLGVFAQSNEILYLPFDNDSENQSSTRLRTIEHGNIRYEADRFGTPCKAIYLDGNSFVEVLDNRAFKSIVNSFSVSTWLKMDKNQGEDAWLTVFCKAEDDLTETATNPHFRAQVFQGSAQSTVSVNTEFTEFDNNFRDHVFPSNEWMHFVLTYDGSDVITYLNGREFWRFPYTGRLYKNSSSLFIGKDYPGSIEYFRGWFDDMYLFDYGLSAREVSNLYHKAPSYELTNVEIPHPGDIVQNTEQGTCGSSVNYYTPQNNICEPAQFELIQGKPSGAYFPVGKTINVFKVTQGTNMSVYRHTIEVEDKVKPTINCPSDQTVSTDSDTWTLANPWNAQASDNCQIASIDRIDPYTSQKNFKAGDYQISFKALDVAGNEATCSFNLTVQSTKRDIDLECPNDMTVYTETNTWKFKETWKLKYDKKLEDDIASIKRIDPYANQTELKVGTYKIEYKLTDIYGNEATCSFNLTVERKKKDLSLDCPNDKTVYTYNDTWNFKKTWTVNYDQNIQGAKLERIDSYVGQTKFSIGTYKIEYKLSDAYGNEAKCSFNLIVKKKRKRIALECPMDTLITITSNVWKYEESWKNRIKYAKGVKVANLERIDAHRFKTEYAPGTYEIKYRLTDTNGSKATCSFNLVIEKKTPPPTGISVECPNDTTIYVVGDHWEYKEVWKVKYAQSVQVASLERIDRHKNTKEFKLGTYTLKYKLTDVNGATATCSFKLKIESSKITVKKTYDFKTKEVVMVLYDNKTQDGDRVSIYFNGKKIENDYMVLNKDNGVLTKTLIIESGKPNIIVIQALNTGDVGRNTVQVDFYEKKRKKVDPYKDKPKFTKVYDSRPGYSSGIKLNRK